MNSEIWYWIMMSLVVLGLVTGAFYFGRGDTAKRNRRS